MIGEGVVLPRLHVVLWADEDHCLETAARKEYERLALALLRGEEEDEEAGQRLEILREFLETADFRSLRAQSEGIVKERGRVRAVVFRDGERVCCRLWEP